MLTDLLSSACVPKDLVYFRDGARNLVVNPELGAWEVLDDSELGILRSLANDKPFPDADGQRVERTLARLILGWLIYMPGKQPVLRQVQAPLKMVYYAITDGCNLRCPYCYASSEKPLPGELSTAQSLDLVDQVADMGAEVMDHVSELAELVSGIDISRVRAMHHSDLGRGASDSDSFGWAEYKRLHEFVWTDPRAADLLPDGPLGQKSCETRINCGLGGNEIYVNSLGDVYPCKLVTGREHLAGSVKKTPLRELFASPVLADLRSNAVFADDNLTDCRRRPRGCSSAGGCRAYHMAESGSLKRNSRALCRILRHQMITSM